ncbi:MAG TPA: signal peptidase II [Mycobacteriales bacterium]|nr:signal peptidase II [Mycobacteriales bacterium]
MPEPSTEPASSPADTVEAPSAVTTEIVTPEIVTPEIVTTETVTTETVTTDTVAADEPATPVNGSEASAQPTIDPEAVALEPVESQPEDPGDLIDEDEPSTEGASALAHRRTLIMVLLAIVVLAIDQISKSLVVARLTGHDPVKVAGGAVYLLEVTNKGAAFNLGEGYTALFTAVAAAVVVVMVRVSSRLSSTGWAVALGLILGGAAGNLTDRLFRAPGPLRGAVVDWISLFDPEGRIWPVFNLADSAIVCGGVCAVILMLLGRDLTMRSRRD